MSTNPKCEWPSQDHQATAKDYIQLKWDEITKALVEQAIRGNVAAYLVVRNEAWGIPASGKTAPEETPLEDLVSDAVDRRATLASGLRALVEGGEVKRKRRRPRKAVVAIDGPLRRRTATAGPSPPRAKQGGGDGSDDATVPPSSAPTLADLRLRQLSVMNEELKKIPETHIPRNQGFRNVKTALEWYATPESQRQPKTTFELAKKLGWTENYLEVVRSICAGVIKRMREQIIVAASEYAQLRSDEMMRGMVDKAAQGNSAAFDRVMNLAWNLKPEAFEFNRNRTLSIEEAVAQGRGTGSGTSEDAEADTFESGSTARQA